MRPRLDALSGSESGASAIGPRSGGKAVFLPEITRNRIFRYLYRTNISLKLFLKKIVFEKCTHYE